MKKNEVAILGLFLYKIVYELIYAYAVSPLFSYMLLVYTPNMYKMVLSYALFVMLIVVLPKQGAPVSRFLLSVFLIFTMVPLLSFYWQADGSTRYVMYCVISFVVLSRVTCIPIKIKRASKFVLMDKWSMRKIDVVFVLAVTIVGLLTAVTAKYGFADFRALDLYAIYDVRESRSFTGIYGYIVNWIPYALVPCLLCMSLYLKRWGYTLFAIIIQLYMYLLAGSKTALFSVALILVSYFFVRLKFNYIFIWSMALTFLNIFTFVIWKVLGELMPFGIFPTRLLSLPAAISFLHFDFFSINPKLHFAENFIGRLLGIESPYERAAMYMVSNGRSNSSYCTGYLGDAYDNGGFAAMLLYSVALAFVFRVIDKIYLGVSDKDKEQLPMFVGILTYSMIYLNDGALTALMLTGGLVLTLFLFVIHDNKEYAMKKISLMKGINKNAKEL